VKILLNACVGFVSEIELLLFKLNSIKIDGAPAMFGRTSGFFALPKKNETFQDIQYYHCIIHQQALCDTF